MKPVRIQRQRTKGWKMPENTVSVTRPGPYGNPYFPGCGMGYGNITSDGHRVDWPLKTDADAVRHFRERMRINAKYEPDNFERFIRPLRGKNLACWCKPGEPCHADVLLEIACTPVTTDERG